ncbi:hypothetical protein N7507_000526 [Penicillium longicatenatum]|nr:hypothetical protein N7507_000526 [Penicillium longicatenatum]
MQFQLLPVILASVVFWSQVTTAVAGGQNITILDESDLRADAAHVFLSCLKASNVTYQLFVEDGATIVYPANNRTLDFEGVDEWLEQCMMMTSRTVVAAVMDSVKPSYGYTNSIPATEATYAWLIQQGARGLNVTGTKSMTDESSLFSRAGGEMEEGMVEGRSFSHYWGYMSDAKECPNTNVKICTVGNCIVRTEAILGRAVGREQVLGKKNICIQGRIYFDQGLCSIVAGKPYQLVKKDNGKCLSPTCFSIIVRFMIVLGILMSIYFPTNFIKSY